MNVGDIFVSIRASVADFKNDLAAARAAIRNSTDDMGDDIDELSDRTLDSTRKMGGYFKDVSRIVSGIVIAQAFYKILNAVEEAAQAVWKFSMTLEDANVKYTQLLGSAEKSRQFIGALQEFASKTSFDFESVDTAAGQIKLMGVEAEEVLPILEQLGNAVAMGGGGQEQLKNVTKALRQMYQSPKAQAEELEQFIENGINVSKYLQEQLGLTAEQVKNIGDEAISGKTAIAGILQGMSVDPNLQGAMEKFSNTTKGMLETIKDNSKFIGAGLFSTMFEGMSGRIKQVRDLTDTILQAYNTKGAGGVFEELVPESLQPILRTIIGSVQQLWTEFKRLWAAIEPIVSALGGAFLGIVAALIPIISKLVNILATMIGWLTQNREAVQGLVVALVSLKIAAIASGWIMKLVVALRAGTLAVVTAKAINLLSKALMFLTGVLSKNKIIAILTVLAAVLMGVAASSKTASKWIDGLFSKLAKLAGFDMSDVLVPEDKDDLSKYLDDYNKDIGKITDEMKEEGDAAKDAKKKTDKFLASFDEVFQVPETDGLEEVTDAIKDIDLPDADLDLDDMLPDDPEPLNPDDIWEMPPFIWLPPFKWPKMPKFPDFPDIKIDLPDFDLGYIPDEITALFRNLERSFNRITDAAGNFVRDFANQLGSLPITVASIAAQIGLALTPVGNAFGGIGGLIGNLLGQMGGLRTGIQGGFALLNGVAVDLVGNLGDIMARFGAFIDLVGNMEGITRLVGTFVDLVGNLELVNSLIGITVDLVGNLDLAAALGGRLVDLVGDFSMVSDFLRETLIPTFEAIPSVVFTSLASLPGMAGMALMPLVQVFTSNLGSISNAFSSVFDGLGEMSLTSMTEVATNIGLALAGIITSLGSFVGSWSLNWGSIAHTALDVVRGMFGSLGGAFTAGLEFIKNLWSEHSTAILVILGGIALAVVTVLTGGLDLVIPAVIGFLAEMGVLFARLGPIILAAIRGLPKIFGKIWSKLPPQAKTTITSIGTWFGKLPGRIWDFIKGIPGSFKNLMEGLPKTAGKMVDDIVSFFRDLPGKIWDFIKGIPDMITGVFSRGWDGAKSFFGGIGDFFTGGGGASVASAGVGGSRSSIASFGPDNITGFKKGGIIGKDSIIRAGEQGRREAVVPLDNRTAMAPFADAVAQRMMENMPQQSSQGSESGQVLYVGTLIADDRSLKELNRKMRVIELGERPRGVRR